MALARAPAARGGAARARDRGPHGAAQGEHLLLPRPIPAGRRPGVRGRGFAEAGACAGREGGGAHPGTAPRHPQPARSGAQAVGGGGGGRHPLRRGRAHDGRGDGGHPREVGAPGGRHSGPGGRCAPGPARHRGLASRGAPALRAAGARAPGEGGARPHLLQPGRHAGPARPLRGRGRAVRAGRRGRPRVSPGPELARHRVLQRAAVRQGDRSARPRPGGDARPTPA